MAIPRKHFDAGGALPADTAPFPGAVPQVNQADVSAETAGNPTGTTTAGQNTAIQNLEGEEATNPSLPSGTQQVASLVDPNAAGTNVSSDSGQVSGTVAGQQTSAGPSAQVPTSGFDTTAAQYSATQTGGQGAQGTAAQISPSEQAGNQATAAQGSLSPDQLLSGQMSDLTDFSKGTPSWAQNAVNATNEQMAGRGMANSSIAAGAMTTAIMGAALPVAQGNASAILQMALANLSNQQQANITNANNNTQTSIANLSAENQMSLLNTQNNQAALLSDQAAANAAKQFNATSQEQTTQFFANLATQIATQNAARADAMSQFDAGQANSMAQFNANLQNARDTFNAQNQLVVDQSNAQWQRTINTTNTAAVNAANQVNAQNMFNMTQTAQANLWQQWRDEASWANTASQNALTRQHNLAVAALSSNTAFGLNDQAQSDELASLMGQFGLGVLNAVTSPSKSTAST